MNLWDLNHQRHVSGCLWTLSKDVGDCSSRLSPSPLEHFNNCVCQPSESRLLFTLILTAGCGHVAGPHTEPCGHTLLPRGMAARDRIWCRTKNSNIPASQDSSEIYGREPLSEEK